MTNAPPQLAPERRGRGALKIVFALVGLAGLATGGFFGYSYLAAGKGEGEEEEAAASGASDAAVTPTAAAGESAAPPDASIPDAGPPDAGLTVADGGDVQVEPGPPGTLRVETNPKGAKVYLDGSFEGRTPTELEVADQHRLALIRPGHKLYTTDVSGSGTLRVNLAKVSPPGGPAGIKVRCIPKNHNRYYVFVDGYHIGQLCPTERIGVDLGKHVVEIYDPITDARKSFHVTVEETRLSLRVLVDG